MSVGTEVEAVGDDLDIGSKDLWLLGKLSLEIVDGLLDREIEEPKDNAKGEDVAAAENALCIHATVGKTCLGTLAHWHRHDLHGAGNAELGERIVGSKLSLLQFSSHEGVFVVDQHASLLEELDIGLESRRIHCNEHVALVAWSIDLVAEVQLIRRNTRQ